MAKPSFKKIWILFITFTIITVLPIAAFSAQESSGPNQEIKVVLDDNYPPYSFKDSNGKLQGILIDQWMLWQQKTGISARLHGMDWESALRKFRTDEFDVIDTVFFNEERSKYLDYTKPYAKIEVPVYFQKNISGIADPESLKGFNIAVKAGDTAANILKQKGVDSLIEYANYDAIIEAVKEQKVVIFVIDRPSAMYLMYKNNLQDRFHSTPPLYTGELHRAVLKGNTALLDLVENGFSKISKKEFEIIDRKWFGTPPLKPLPTFELMVFFIVASVLMCILFLWNMTLKKAVETKTRVLSETLEKYRQSEKNIYNLSIRDSLTGLYNRNFFESELNKNQGSESSAPGIVVCDVDGLKLINDTLGHHSGDDYLKDVANILQQCFGKEDIIARIGGDEFAVLIENTSLKEIAARKMKITEITKALNAQERVVPISMSIGYAVGSGTQQNLRELLKAADSLMYREKLLHIQSEKSNTIRILTKMLAARDFITEGHGERMQKLCIKLAEALGLTQTEITDISLFAQFHDIGKVGIPDRILSKPGKLTDEEMEEMKRHTEIGYRIAQSSSDLKHIADWILKHHEWWNGQGYPYNLKGEEIPLQCRILSIVDAYDAMTSSRPYRNALSKESAVEELVNFKGIQFDPALVDKLLELL